MEVSWGVPAVAALLTAAGAFTVGLLLENYRRHRDRQVLAATILSEVDAILDLFASLDMVGRYKSLRNTLQERASRGLPHAGVEDSSLVFPVTVYEKCADKIGLVGMPIAPEIVWFYNLVYGFRSSARMVVQRSDLPIEGRIDTVDYILSLLADGVPRAGGVCGGPFRM